MIELNQGAAHSLFPLIRGKVCALVFVLATCAAPVQAQTISVGIAGPMSGPLADAGRAIAAGALLAVKDINARNGLNGAPIVPLIENDEASLAGARKNAETFAAKNIRIVIGHYTSAPTLVAGEIYARNNILLIAPSATSPKLTERKGANVLRLAPREETQGAYAGQLLAREFPNGRIAIMRDGSAAARILSAAALAAMKAAGAANIMEAEISAVAADAAASAANYANALASENISVVYWAGGGANIAPFLKALRSAGSAASVLGSDMLASADIAATAGDALEGVRMSVIADTTQSPAAKEVAARLRADGVRDMSLALANYASLQVLEEAAIRAKGNDPAKLGMSMRNGPPVNTIIGPVSFDSAGERREQLYAIAVWKKSPDGKFIFALL